MVHLVESLFASMSDVAPYPAGVVALPARLPGVGFFPGGAGLWNVSPGHPLPPMPVRGVMVLGHDFHSEDAFAKSLAEGTEVRLSPTWPALLRLLKVSSIPYESCFFTNAYMGLRRGSATMGRFPGSRDAGFRDRCRRFLLRQLGAQKPTLILTLGRWLPEFIAPLSPQLQPWAKAKSFSAIDAASPVMSQVRFDGADAPPCTVVALTHPCLRGPNVRWRRYGALLGHAAEVEMLRSAAAGLDGVA